MGDENQLLLCNNREPPLPSPYVHGDDSNHLLHPSWPSHQTPLLEHQLNNDKETSIVSSSLPQAEDTIIDCSAIGTAEAHPHHHTVNTPISNLLKYPTPSIVRQAFFGVTLYIILGVIAYILLRGSFKCQGTFRLVDALYFSVVTLCTIGYGDIVPETTAAKMFTCVFILVGFGFIDILLNGLVTYLLDRQEAIMLSAMDGNSMFKAVVMDVNKGGRMRIRLKVSLALAVVVGCVSIGTIAIHSIESLDWGDSFYLSVTSVTTVGYGDYAFKTVEGRCFAIVWLLVSTLAVARAFLYMAELRIDKRNRKIADWVLEEEKQKIISDLAAADTDNHGSIRLKIRESKASLLSSNSELLVGFICQICEQDSHLAYNCPFLYTECKVNGCKGIRKLQTSNTGPNLGRKFLRCHMPHCIGFEWLDVAAAESKHDNRSSSISRRISFNV